jgi:hypothetical protein
MPTKWYNMMIPFFPEKKVLYYKPGLKKNKLQTGQRSMARYVSTSNHQNWNQCTGHLAKAPCQVMETSRIDQAASFHEFEATVPR